MNGTSKKLIHEYLKNIQDANSESAKKSLFKTLLVRLFDKDPLIARLIDEFDTGAETTVFNIPLAHRTKTGSADTQYRNVIIEFEKDLKKTEAHAKEQLIEYLSGNWLSGNNLDFVLVSTDCITWKIYFPDYEKLINVDIISTGDVELEEKDSFILTEKNGEDFYYFIDHYLFRTQAQKPTYQSIKKDFGDSSSTFLFAIRELSHYYSKIEGDSELQIAFEQWNLFLSIAYGSFKATPDVFLIHTYLSVFSKILAYAVITKHQFITDDEMKEILSGEIFNKLNVNNFIESDFYHWIAKDRHYNKLKNVFRRIATQLSDYDFSKVDEDVLKGVYQELIDIETKHKLGEYYTPDWLAEIIVEELPLKKNSMILDPACGSGSFLRASISKIKNDFPEITLEEILSQIVGIDIHPLSVQIAKTTVLLATADRMKKLKRPINIQVFLANTLIIPADKANLFENKFDVIINKEKYELTRSLLDDSDPSFYNNAISFCENLAQMDADRNEMNELQFGESLKNSFKNNPIDKDIIDGLHRIYLALKSAIEKKQNSIWSFILQNSYKPFFLEEKFDFIVGNPPWLPYRDMNNESYQNQLLELAKKYNLVPKYSSITHLELAAIFLSHCSSTFLKKNGQIAFVLPRGFLSADHHENTRNGSAQGFRLTHIWDLKDVSPLFRITSCVMFAKRNIVKSKQAKTDLVYTDGELKGYVLRGNLPAHHVNFAEAEGYLAFRKVKWFYSQLGERTSFSTQKIEYKSGKNYYINEFKQGATIVPRNLYFIELTQSEPDDFEDRIMHVQTDQEIKKDAKEPWKGIELKMSINSLFLFRTALAKNILPFTLINPTLVHLPIEIDENQHPVLLHWREIRKKGFIESSKWFQSVEDNWDKYKTEKSKEMTYLDRLEYQRGITEQNIYKKHLVLYTASAKDANATIVERKKIDLPFIIESATYWYATNDKDEANYLAAYINSNYANEAIKDFQASGLFGERHVHKKILELPLPQFSSLNSTHQKISEISKTCIDKVDKFISTMANSDQIRGIKLGNARLAIRELLKEELQEIDLLLKKIIM